MVVGANRSKGRRGVAADVWRMMSQFTLANFQRGEHVEILRGLGLTPGHLKALSILDADEPRPMRAMADALRCDASMVTWLVDRLEERGLVERHSLPSDRRVKTVALTSAGIRTREQLLAAVGVPPDDLMTLDTDSLHELRDLLERLPAPQWPIWGREAAPRARAG
jgi:DNA-binding MarR family transcriptional regulator